MIRDGDQQISVYVPEMNVATSLTDDFKAKLVQGFDDFLS